MAIEIIDTLKQKNNGTFGLVDSNDIIGGFYQTDNITERNSIPLNRRKEGMFCWVKEEKKVFQLVDGLTNECWIEFKSGSSNGGGTIIDGYAHIWIGDKPPEDKNMLWLDTNSDGILEDETDIETVKKLLNKISDLEIKISLLTKRVAYLEKHGVVNPDKPDTPDTPISIGLLLEDGTPLLLEDGTPLLLEEEKSEGSSNVINGILLEDKTNILLEDKTPLLLE
jgi:hypothetical protein|nr:MAG TPA_asm: hypothetical protein [Caudoviricetes sp.]